jgi:hypothetical protein
VSAPLRRVEEPNANVKGHTLLVADDSVTTHRVERITTRFGDRLSADVLTETVTQIVSGVTERAMSREIARRRAAESPEVAPRPPSVTEISDAVIERIAARFGDV